MASEIKLSWPLKALAVFFRLSPLAFFSLRLSLQAFSLFDFAGLFSAFGFRLRFWPSFWALLRGFGGIGRFFNSL
jgi:hypothetical protein